MTIDRNTRPLAANRKPRLSRPAPPGRCTRGPLGGIGPSGNRVIDSAVHRSHKVEKTKSCQEASIQFGFPFIFSFFRFRLICLHSLRLFTTIPPIDRHPATLAPAHLCDLRPLATGWSLSLPMPLMVNSCSQVAGSAERCGRSRPGRRCSPFCWMSSCSSCRSSSWLSCTASSCDISGKWIKVNNNDARHSRSKSSTLRRCGSCLLQVGLT